MITSPIRASLALACIFAALSSVTLAADTLPSDISTKGEAVLLQAHATGAQIYECKAGTDGKLGWIFREPVANLVVKGETVGHHYPGPSWQLKDGSTITGKVTAKHPGTSKEDIAWLMLDVVDHQGKGAFASVTTVQRINTRGGALSGACDMAGEEKAVPYSADYVFSGKSK
nr:DUF3455 domain-containing protein [uncultured Gellertiella sp.]